MQSIKLSSVVLFPDNSNCNWHLMNTFDPIIQIMGTFPKQYTHGVLQSLFFLFVAVNKIVNHGKVDISSVGSRLTEAMNIIAEKGCHKIRVGDRVKVSSLDIQMQDTPHPHNKLKPFEPLGTVRFIGTVDFVEEDEL